MARPMTPEEKRLMWWIAEAARCRRELEEALLKGYAYLAACSALAMDRYWRGAMRLTGEKE